MTRALRHGLLALLLLLAQAGALAHGIGHHPDQAGGNEPVCEQCLAFAPMGAGAASTAPAWLSPPPDLPRNAATDSAFSPVARLGYQSRAPPHPIR